MTAKKVRKKMSEYCENEGIIKNEIPKITAQIPQSKSLIVIVVEKILEMEIGSLRLSEISRVAVRLKP